MRNDVDLSDKEVERYKELSASANEIVETATMRLSARIDSFEQAQTWFTKMRQAYHDAIVALAEDPFDDFETAFQKAHKFEEIESDFECASQRLNFELREARKVGIAPP